MASPPMKAANPPHTLATIVAAAATTATTIPTFRAVDMLITGGETCSPT